jgi:hypothetical protein
MVDGRREPLASAVERGYPARFSGAGRRRTPDPGIPPGSAALSARGAGHVPAATLACILTIPQPATP